MPELLKNNQQQARQALQLEKARWILQPAAASEWQMFGAGIGISGDAGRNWSLYFWSGWDTQVWYSLPSLTV